MGVFLNSATNSYNVVSLYSHRLEQKVNFELLDLGGQSTDPCPDENLSWRTLDIPEYDEASRLQEYDGKRCVMEEGILLMPALHKVESGNGVILCVDLVQQACTTLNAPHSLSLEDSEINLQLWRGKPALSFVSEEKLNVCILEDYKTQTWADTILIPLPNLNNAIPRVKKQIPQIHRMDEEDFLFYTDDFYTNGVKGYRVCKTGSEELIFSPTPPPTRVPATLVSVKELRSGVVYNMEEVESAPGWLLQRLCNDDEEQPVIIAKTLSGIWFARNRRVWEGKQLDPGTLMALSSKQITEWQGAQKKTSTPTTEHDSGSS